MPIAWAAIVVAAVLGLVLYAIVGGIERALIPWHVSIRNRE
jgi:NitT/TauT family transport system permease protein